MARSYLTLIEGDKSTFVYFGINTDEPDDWAGVYVGYLRLDLNEHNRCVCPPKSISCQACTILYLEFAAVDGRKRVSRRSVK